MTGKINIVSTKWYYYPDENSSNDAFDTSKAFEAGTRYVAVVEVEAVSPYIFSETPRIDVNVGDHTGQILQRSSDGKRLTIYIDFSICPKSTCIVSFDANGGTGVQNAITVDYGIRFGAPPCEFTPPAGKQFNGWSTDPNDRSGNIRFMVAKSDITFYATWVKIKEEPTGYTLSGTATSFGSETDEVMIQLTESGAAEPAYEAVVKGNSASYSITDVAPGTYTMKVMKNNHVPQEYTVNIDSADTVQDVILYLRGDANMDGKISLMDVNRIIRHLASWSVEINLDNADYDANGKVNLVDVSKLIKLLAGK